MTRTTIAGGAVATVIGLLAVVAGYRALHKDAHPAAAKTTGFSLRVSAPSTALRLNTCAAGGWPAPSRASPW